METTYNVIRNQNERPFAEAESAAQQALRDAVAAAYRKGRADGQLATDEQLADARSQGRAYGVESIHLFIDDKFMEATPGSADEFLYCKLREEIEERFQ
jgi:hypothetical protein